MTDHMLKSYEMELGNLRQKILHMGETVGGMIAHAAQYLFEGNFDLGAHTIEKDREVNAIDLEIDRLCIDILARYQPVAVDLRAISTAMRVSFDLERVGDEAVNICEQAAELGKQVLPDGFCSLPEMAGAAQGMFRDAMAAYENHDNDLAQRVCDSDKSVDEFHEDTVRRLSSLAAEGSVPCGAATRLMFVSKYLERIADHATNIAEMVIYLEKGVMVRHATEHAREP